LAENFSQAAGSQKNVTFDFRRHAAEQGRPLRLAHDAAKNVSLDTRAHRFRHRRSASSRSRAPRSRSTVISQALRGGLQLRAKSADGQEIGRSEATEKLKQAADSAGFFTFKFDARAPLARRTQYSLHSATPKKP
jgi:hypothetical protein